MLDGLSPDEAFAILGNEVRLAVIRVLWRADAAREYDDGSDTATTMPYSRLQDEVDGANVQQWSDAGADHQRWQLERL